MAFSSQTSPAQQPALGRPCPPLPAKLEIEPPLNTITICKWCGLEARKDGAVPCQQERCGLFEG